MAARTPSTPRDHALIQAGMILASELSLEVVLQRIVELAVEITDARYGALGVLTPDRQAIEEFITVGVTAEERAAIGDPPVGHGVLGVLIDEVGPLRLPDIGADPRIGGFPPNHPRCDRSWGRRSSPEASIRQHLPHREAGGTRVQRGREMALVVLATQAGVAIENARLYEEAQHAQRELARLELLEDRERIAKEFHDGVIQSLVRGRDGAAGDGRSHRRRRSDATARRCGGGDRPAIGTCATTSSGSGRASWRTANSVRRSTSSVGSSRRDRGGDRRRRRWQPRLRASLPRCRRRGVHARGPVERRARHAGATTCRVSPGASRKVGLAVLEVDDDGTGFDPRGPGRGWDSQTCGDRIDGLAAVGSRSRVGWPRHNGPRLPSRSSMTGRTSRRERAFGRYGGAERPSNSTCSHDTSWRSPWTRPASEAALSASTLGVASRPCSTRQTRTGMHLLAEVGFGERPVISHDAYRAGRDGSRHHEDRRAAAVDRGRCGGAVPRARSGPRDRAACARAALSSRSAPDTCRRSA